MTRDIHVLVAPVKMFCPETLLKNPDLDIDKNCKKIKTNCLRTDGLSFYKSNLQ